MSGSGPIVTVFFNMFYSSCLLFERGKTTLPGPQPVKANSR